MRVWVFRLLGLGFILILGAYFTVPSLWRVLTPTLFGQVKLAENVYVDDVGAAGRKLPMISKSDAVSAAFFG